MRKTEMRPVERNETQKKNNNNFYNMHNNIHCFHFIFFLFGFGSLRI